MDITVFIKMHVTGHGKCQYRMNSIYMRNVDYDEDLHANVNIQ